MLCEPIARVEVLRVAIPWALRVTTPRELAPSVKVTEPTGELPLPVMVAVKVTGAPKVAGLELA